MSLSVFLGQVAHLFSEMRRSGFEDGSLNITNTAALC